VRQATQVKLLEVHIRRLSREFRESQREPSPDHDNPVDKIVLGDAKIIEGALLAEENLAVFHSILGYNAVSKYAISCSPQEVV
jgi:hypothetical protein